MPRARGRALVALCAALADGTIALDRGPDRDEVRHALLDLPGIGPWTADYVAMRALGHPDVFLPTDVGIRDALTAPGPRPARRRRSRRGLATVALLRPAAPVADTGLHPQKETTDMWTLMDSPVGELRIVEHDGAITAIEFSPFRPSTDGRPIGERDDDHPVLAEAVGQLTAYFARDLKEFDLPLAPQGSDFQRRVWDAAARHRLRRDRVVRRDRPPARHDQRRLARGRPGQRPQPDPDRDPVPPGDRRQRDAHRLRRRTGAQADAARARTGRAVLSAWDGGSVWYAGYGSNLDPDRFHRYLRGGRPAGATRTYPGARDRADPLDTRAFTMPGGWCSPGSRRRGAEGSPSTSPIAEGSVLACAYLVTAGQLADVLEQEMWREPGADLDLTEVVSARGT